MSSIVWTPEQDKAVTKRGFPLLVAAAAGAGKTAVLVARIVHAVTQSTPAADVDRFLVVTFTDSAGGEMRRRLGEELIRKVRANPADRRAKRQLLLLPRASIGTLHSFCSDLVRRHFYLLDLDPGFRILEENEARMLRQDVLDRVLDELYEKGGDPSFDQERFFHLARAFSSRQGDDRPLAELIFKLHDFACTLPRPRAWLKNLAADLAEAAVRPWEKQTWFADWLTCLKKELRRAKENLLTALSLAASPGGPGRYRETLAEDAARIARLISLLEEQPPGIYSRLQKALAGLEWAELPRLSKTEAGERTKKQVQELRNTAKEILRDLFREWLAPSEEDWRKDLALTAPLVETLSAAVLRFDEAYREAKKERGTADFADLEHYALAVLAADAELSPWGERPPEDPDAPLTPSPVAREYRHRLKEVLVDEYQDINGVQEAILGLVSPPDGFFAVGDVKQSIYRFRLADPQVFLCRYENAADLPERGNPPESPGRDTGYRLDLNANFRSRPQVLETVNELFRRLMTRDVGELDYDRRAKMTAAFSYPEPDSGQPAGPVEFHVLESAEPPAEKGGNENNGQKHGTAPAAEPSAKKEGTEEEGEEGEEIDPTGEEPTALSLEARWVAWRLRRLVKEEKMPVFERETGRYRPVTWRDVVILLRSPRNRAAVFLEELLRLEVPAYADAPGGYFAAPEVQVVLSLLHLLDNPRQDIPLAAVLRSPIGGLDAAALARIRLACPTGDLYTAVEKIVTGEAAADSVIKERLAVFWQQLHAWRDRARLRPPAEVLEEIYRATGYYDLVGALPGGKSRQANLNALVDRARQFAGTVYRGLFRFLRYIERLQEEGGDLDAARTLAQSEDVVRIMSIHRSKGLEFPVVVVAGLGWRFNFRDLNAPFLCHRRLGCGPRVYDLERGVTYPTVKHLVIRERLRGEALAEEMRLLYVALTRAREKLIVTGAVRELSGKLENWRVVAQSAEAPERPLPSPYREEARSFLDWTGPALLANQKAVRHLFSAERKETGKETTAAAGPWCLTLWPAASLSFLRETEKREAAPDVPETFAKPSARLLTLTPFSAEELVAAETAWRAAGKTVVTEEELKERIFWEDPRRLLSRIPGKVAVTELRHHGETATEAEDGETEPLFPLPPPDRKSAFVPDGHPGFPPPAFLSAARKDPAARGRAVHLFMQKLDLSVLPDEEELRRQLLKLTSAGILAAEEASLIPVGEVARFFTTPLGKRVAGAARAGLLWREVPFLLGIPAAELYPELAKKPPPDELAGEIILLQGVIDCLFEEENGFVLVDYKTDRLTNEELEAAAGRYAGQLRWYARAAGEILRRPVREGYLYFFAAGKEIMVETGQKSG